MVVHRGGVKRLRAVAITHVRRGPALEQQPHHRHVPEHRRHVQRPLAPLKVGPPATASRSQRQPRYLEVAVRCMA